LTKQRGAPCLRLCGSGGADIIKININRKTRGVELEQIKGGPAAQQNFGTQLAAKTGKKIGQPEDGLQRLRLKTVLQPWGRLLIDKPWGLSSAIWPCEPESLDRGFGDLLEILGGPTITLTSRSQVRKLAHSIRYYFPGLAYHSDPPRHFFIRSNRLTLSGRRFSGANRSTITGLMGSDPFLSESAISRDSFGQSNCVMPG